MLHYGKYGLWTDHLNERSLFKFIREGNLSTHNLKFYGFDIYDKFLSTIAKEIESEDRANQHLFNVLKNSILLAALYQWKIKDNLNVNTKLDFA